MLPSILAKQLEKGVRDYLEATFPMTNEMHTFDGAQVTGLALRTCFVVLNPDSVFNHAISAV